MSMLMTLKEVLSIKFHRDQLILTIPRMLKICFYEVFSNHSELELDIAGTHTMAPQQR